MAKNKPATIATWNINSVRLRMPLVQKFVERFAPDVLCLQEIKCDNGSFPEKDLRALGYEHIAVHGQKAYHGVATLSRLPFAETDKFDFCGKGDARHLHVRFGDKAGALAGLTLHNFYVPAGGDEPDPDANPKFAHKLEFLSEMKTRSGDMCSNGSGRTLLVGDLNVAPLESDVWSHKQLLKVVSHTPIECDHLNAVIDAGKWVDVMRTHIPPEEKLFTWWSYRAADWELSNKGRRLDHVWASPKIAKSVSSIAVVKEARGWDKPSDHVPVIATLS